MGKSIAMKYDENEYIVPFADNQSTPPASQAQPNPVHQGHSGMWTLVGFPADASVVKMHQPLRRSARLQGQKVLDFQVSGQEFAQI